jgi:hypothetical protein
MAMVVMKPLDLGVFSSLKHHSRKEVGLYALLTDSSPIGKQNFLRCYHKARIEALCSKNIKAGWKATGLLPKSMAKPLMSPLLLENSNKVKETPQNTLGSQSIDSISIRNQGNPGSPELWPTPKSSTQLKAHTARFQKLQVQNSKT